MRQILDSNQPNQNSGLYWLSTGREDEEVAPRMTRSTKQIVSSGLFPLLLSSTSLFVLASISPIAFQLSSAGAPQLPEYWFSIFKVKRANTCPQFPGWNPGSFLFFLNYILLIMLLHLSQFFSLHLPLPSPAPCTLRQSPLRCPCPWVMHICSSATLFLMLYFTSPWLFCNYQFVLLNSLTFFSQPLNPPPIWQPSKCSLYQWVCFCSACLFILLFRCYCW